MQQRVEANEGKAPGLLVSLGRFKQEAFAKILDSALATAKPKAGSPGTDTAKPASLTPTGKAQKSK